MRTDFLNDPLWYKDAIIYELHVRSFADATGDGVGDFQGLREKLPYIDSLGVNTLWLLPFLESPLKDDGYDTADYFKILPVHGTMEDFQAFLDEAHSRDMRVITELVLNHTSDQHPWFQEARDPDSPKHDWYVWSETSDRYNDARIIFTDTETSNWTWDPKAQKYYWHRFFSHQPDLNYDNPEVHKAMKEVLFYWLDMGVDGLRLDAVPYLYEREGTNCENLPETLEFVKDLRQAVDERYGPGKVLLAEANQWPEETLPYFGDGDGVQMAFNFPIMPRMYMALRRENRRPLVEMLELTNDIPEEAQWALFLRNHDELTLEMVTDEERDYMIHEYAADPSFRINVGIRRRLAPLLEGERRRIELMNALLLSLKGSPIIYYGDEIGMGDDPFLGDRNGVRTPMQWSPDKNGGFSDAPRHKLFLPPISEGRYSYDFVNVESADNDPHSLLTFMRRIIGLRKQYNKVFGRGSFAVIPVENQRVFAFIREYEERKILVTVNLSRFSQSFHLPVLEEYRGMTPVELFSQMPLPPFGDDSYHMMLGPHDFYWFRLDPEEAVRERHLHHENIQMQPITEDEQLPTLRVDEGIQNLVVTTMVQHRGMEKLEGLLPEYLGAQRWFGAQSDDIQAVNVDDAIRLQREPRPVYLTLISVETSSNSNLYVLPLTLSHGKQADQILDHRAHTAIAWLDVNGTKGLLHDAVVIPEFWETLFRWWQSGKKGRSLKGLYVQSRHGTLEKADPAEVQLLIGEQSNSAAIIDNTYFVKLYRRIEQGTNPETELLEYLTRANFPFIPQLQGTVTFKRQRDTYSLGILQEALPVESDGWNYTLDLVDAYLDRVADARPPDELVKSEAETDQHPVWLQEYAPEIASMAQVLGIRTAELHLAMERAQESDMEPKSIETDFLDTLIETIEKEAQEIRSRLADENAMVGETPSSADWERALTRLNELKGTNIPGQRIRIHGDYHLGQVIRADGEFYILDFEGEPARSLTERRRRDMGLRDVAGMVRSIEYAILAGYHEHEGTTDHLEQWTSQLLRQSKDIFTRAYFNTAESGNFLPARDVQQPYLWMYLFQKVLYEVRYEFNHRPTWAWIPVQGLTTLLAPSSGETNITG